MIKRIAQRYIIATNNLDRANKIFFINYFRINYTTKGKSSFANFSKYRLLKADKLKFHPLIDKVLA